MNAWTFLKRLLTLDRTEFIYPCCGATTKLIVPLRHKSFRRRCDCSKVWFFDWKGDKWDVGNTKPMPPTEVQVVPYGQFDPKPFDNTEPAGAFEGANLQSDEAVEQFREKVRQGVCGITSEADRLRGQRLLALYEGEYHEKMTYSEFIDKVIDGDIKEPDPLAWKIQKQFWYDRTPTTIELEQCRGRRPSKLRCAVLLWLRSDQTMWIAQVFFYSFLEGPSNLDIAKLKIKNAVQLIQFASEKGQPETKVTDEEYLAEVEGKRMEVMGNYFETDDLIPVIAGMPL